MLLLLWKWAVAKHTRTWVMHGLASVAVATLFGIVFRWFNKEGLIAFAAGSTLMFVFYILREMADEMVHRAKGDWHKYEYDQVGDLIGPAFVCIAAWAVYFFAA